MLASRHGFNKSVTENAIDQSRVAWYEMAESFEFLPVIAIGTSTGGLAALRTIAAGLPTTLPAAVCVVQHIDGHQSRLPALLDASGPLPAVEAKDNGLLKPGHIYVAAPDHHLIVAGGNLHLTRGPRENFVRPAVDPLLRSAAEALGRRAIGVVLTGRLSDGAAGLYEIKRRGGVAVVQDPDEAEAPGMPQAAISYVDVDYCVRLAMMPQLLSELANRLSEDVSGASSGGDVAAVKDSFAQNRPPTLTCPECGGSMHLTALGPLLKFDCHIGHSVTAESMASGQFDAMEKSFESALRRMNERAELCRLMREKALSTGRPAQAEDWQLALEQAQRRSTALRQLLGEDWVKPEQ
jgi:two-component system, chemotaxis family, protein-glutamate methylesterase/glutaminase